MYELLMDIAGRPDPFSFDTVRELWTRPHLAKQMLSAHLDQESDRASRRLETINRTVSWLDGRLTLSSKSLCDLGCGPGLYTERFAAAGARVTGIDFSRLSLDFAVENGDYPVRYIEADYVLDKLPGGFDIITLIFADYGSLSAEKRGDLLSRMYRMLKPGGLIVMDVLADGALSAKQEITIIEENFMNGFWSPGKYVGIQRTLIYDEASVSLDRYVIVEPSETWQIYNWTQYFSESGLEQELTSAGFRVEQMTGDLCGMPLDADSEFISVIASRVD